MPTDETIDDFHARVMSLRYHDVNANGPALSVASSLPSLFRLDSVDLKPRPLVSDVTLPREFDLADPERSHTNFVLPIRDDDDAAQLLQSAARVGPQSRMAHSTTRRSHREGSASPPTTRSAAAARALAEYETLEAQVQHEVDPSPHFDDAERAECDEAQSVAHLVLQDLVQMGNRIEASKKSTVFRAPEPTPPNAVGSREDRQQPISGANVGKEHRVVSSDAPLHPGQSAYITNPADVEQLLKFSLSHPNMRTFAVAAASRASRAVPSEAKLVQAAPAREAHTLPSNAHELSHATVRAITSTVSTVLTERIVEEQAKLKVLLEEKQQHLQEQYQQWQQSAAAHAHKTQQAMGRTLAEVQRHQQEILRRTTTATQPAEAAVDASLVAVKPTRSKLGVPADVVRVGDERPAAHPLTPTTAGAAGARDREPHETAALVAKALHMESRKMDDERRMWQQALETQQRMFREQQRSMEAQLRRVAAQQQDDMKAEASAVLQRATQQQDKLASKVAKLVDARRSEAGHAAAVVAARRPIIDDDSAQRGATQSAAAAASGILKKEIAASQEHKRALQHRPAATQTLFPTTTASAASGALRPGTALAGSGPQSQSIVTIDSATSTVSRSFRDVGVEVQPGDPLVRPANKPSGSSSLPPASPHKREPRSPYARQERQSSPWKPTASAAPVSSQATLSDGAAPSTASERDKETSALCDRDAVAATVQAAAAELQSAVLHRPSMEMPLEVSTPIGGRRGPPSVVIVTEPGPASRNSDPETADSILAPTRCVEMCVSAFMTEQQTSDLFQRCIEPSRGHRRSKPLVDHPEDGVAERLLTREEAQMLIDARQRLARIRQFSLTGAAASNADDGTIPIAAGESADTLLLHTVTSGLIHEVLAEHVRGSLKRIEAKMFALKDNDNAQPTENAGPPTFPLFPLSGNEALDRRIMEECLAELTLPLRHGVPESLLQDKTTQRQRVEEENQKRALVEEALLRYISSFLLREKAKQDGSVGLPLPCLEPPQAHETVPVRPSDGAAWLTAPTATATEPPHPQQLVGSVAAPVIHVSIDTTPISLALRECILPLCNPVTRTLPPSSVSKTLYCEDRRHSACDEEVPSTALLPAAQQGLPPRSPSPLMVSLAQNAGNLTPEEYESLLIGKVLKTLEPLLALQQRHPSGLSGVQLSPGRELLDSSGVSSASTSTASAHGSPTAVPVPAEFIAQQQQMVSAEAVQRSRFYHDAGLVFNFLLQALEEEKPTSSNSRVTPVPLGLNATTTATSAAAAAAVPSALSSAQQPSPPLMVVPQRSETVGVQTSTPKDPVTALIVDWFRNVDPATGRAVEVAAPNDTRLPAAGAVGACQPPAALVPLASAYDSSSLISTTHPSSVDNATGLHHFIRYLPDDYVDRLRHPDTMRRTRADTDTTITSLYDTATSVTTTSADSPLPLPRHRSHRSDNNQQPQRHDVRSLDSTTTSTNTTVSSLSSDELRRLRTQHAIASAYWPRPSCERVPVPQLMEEVR